MNQYITIFKPKIARFLLKKGYAIVDIKADKENPIKTIFIFNRSENLLEDLYSFEK